MKYCQYCGAELPEGTFSFCAVCGNPLKEETPQLLKRGSKGRKRTGTHGKRKGFGKQRKKSIRKQHGETSDDEYDGYYDDVLPSDDGKVRQDIDRQTVKRIIGLVAAVLITICACVLLMYLL